MRARPALNRLKERKSDKLAALAKLLRTLSHEATLERGFALVRAEDGKLIRSTNAAERAAHMTLTFADGDMVATPLGDGTPPPAPAKQTVKTPDAKPAQKPADKKPKGSDQGSLF